MIWLTLSQKKPQRRRKKSPQNREKSKGNSQLRAEGRGPLLFRWVCWTNRNSLERSRESQLVKYIVENLTYGWGQRTTTKVFVCLIFIYQLPKWLKFLCILTLCTLALWNAPYLWKVAPTFSLNANCITHLRLLWTPHIPHIKYGTMSCCAPQMLMHCSLLRTNSSIHFAHTYNTKKEVGKFSFIAMVLPKS